MIKQDLLAFCGTDDPLTLKLRGGNVLRYHAEGDLIRQSTAEHSWRAGVICLHLWPQASATLLAAVMHHDIAEGYVGDTPAPVKRDVEVNSAINRISGEIDNFLHIPPIATEDKLKLKICDYVEGYLTCIERDSHRSRQIAGIFSQYVRELAIELPPEDRARVYTILGNAR